MRGLDKEMMGLETEHGQLDIGVENEREQKWLECCGSESGG
jgi:hypothetical protein